MKRGAAVALSVVGSSKLPEPPYPADTQSKGWRFEIDYQRVEQSTTWALAVDDLRPWLLMLWYKAWQQHPVGTLPDDDEAIAGIIRMPVGAFTAHRKVLMRGWVKHADGRLYHAALTARVHELLQVRDEMRSRQAAYRAVKKNNALHPMSHDVTRVSRVTNDTGTGTGTGTGTTEAALNRIHTSVGGGGVEEEPFQLACDAASVAPAAPSPDGQETKLTKHAKRVTKGRRLGPDDPLPDEWRDYAVKVTGCTHQRAWQVYIEFRNYWSDRPGEGGLKLTWFGTWKNHIDKLHAKGEL